MNMKMYVDMGERTQLLMASVQVRMLIVRQKSTMQTYKAHMQGSSALASATKTPPVYAVMDKSKKMGVQWKEDNGYTVASIHNCTMPKMGTMSDKWKGVVASGAKEEGEYRD